MSSAMLYPVTWAVPVVLCGHILTSDLDIPCGHLLRLVAQYGLQGEGIATIHNPRHSKRMAQPVRVQVDPCGIAGASETGPDTAVL